MSNPTFDGITLTTRAGRCSISSPRVRAWSDTLPGVNGEFVQLAGTGGRKIIVSGYLSASASGSTAARSALSEAIRQRGRKADGKTAATFCGTDLHSYEMCILISYRHGTISIARDSDESYTAFAAVVAELLQVSP